MRLKRVKALVMAGVLVLTTAVAVPATANADHRNPKTGGWCNNTYFMYKENSVTSVYVIAPHALSDGRSCGRTRMSYDHDKLCSACGGTIEKSVIFQCTERHSTCPDTSKTCD